MKDIEIPLKEDRKFSYRFFEILPGFLSWSMLALPFILSAINVTLAATFVIGFVLIYLTRAFAICVRALQGYRRMRQHQKMDWDGMLEDLSKGEIAPDSSRPKWHADNMARLKSHPSIVEPEEVLQAVIIATYKESREVLEPTIKAVLESDYNAKKIILVLAYEERGGERTKLQAQELVNEYKDSFYHVMACEHPSDIPNELIGKGGNVTFAGQQVQKYLSKEHIDPKRVIVTTLDADNRPDKSYFAALSYLFLVCPNPLSVSFQPMAIYNNNIWDAPAPMRVVATGNSFFHIAHSQRQHMLRNFSAHSQSMQALIDMNFWSVRSIVEDGHHYWRSYMHFDGHYTVLPLYLPIYQDAVLSTTYLKTIKAQFLQYRRWTWGASDISYVAVNGFLKKNRISKLDLLPKFWRLLEGHVNWAVGPIISLGAGFIPAFIHPQSIAANELPVILGRIQTVALLGVLAQVFICFKTLPPKPERYKHHRTLFMILQWGYMPVTGLVFNSFAALYSQTRLMLGKYIEKFDVTDKAVITDDNVKHI